MNPALAHAVILNPLANAGRGAQVFNEIVADPWALASGLKDLPRYGGEPEPGALAAWMIEQLREGRRNFVACGGDGTLNLVINSVLQAPELRDAKIGAIALGSSNDFHKPFDAPERRRVAGRPARVSFANAILHDVGKAIFPTGERGFAINASVGVTAEANDFFNQSPGAMRMLKQRWVDGAILTSALLTFARYKNLELEVELEEGKRRLIALTNLSVIKNRHFSGTFRYDAGPGADDGRLHLHLCEEMSRTQMLRTLAGLSRGRFTGRKKTLSSEGRLAAVRSVSGTEFAVETDGEVTRTTQVRFEVLEKRVQLCP